MTDPQPDIPQHYRDKASDLLRAHLALDPDPGVQAMNALAAPPAEAVDRVARKLMEKDHAQYRAIIATLDAESRAVLRTLTDGEVVYPAADIAGDAGVPLRRTRLILRNLRDAGLAKKTALYCDGMLAGSGTYLTGLGEKVVRELEALNG